MDREIDRTELRRRQYRRVGATLAAAIPLMLGWWWLPGLLHPSLRRSDIRTSVVDRGTVQATVQASGNVLPASEKVLTSPDDARVLRILKQPGESLTPGEGILELDTSATQLELGRLVERTAQKQSERRQLQLELEKELADLESRSESKRLDEELLRYRLQQQRELHSDGLTSESALRQAEVELQKAGVELQQLERAVDNARKTAAAGLERLDLDLRILEREREETRHRLDLAETRSDRAGVLTWVVEREGSAVRRGEEIARIADLDSFRVEATVSDAYSARLAAGQPVRARADGQLLRGRIATILPAIEDGAARFLVDLEQSSHPALRQNLRVDVFVVTDERHDVLRLRKGPFAQTGRRQKVFVVRGDAAHRTDVELGISGHEHYEIVSGLDEGHEVILSGMQDFLHLERVRLK